jgi:ABC-2 type transport system permease protein
MNSLYCRIRIATISFLNELKAIYTDKGALLILFGASIVYPIAYSIAYKNNVLREIPVAVVDLDRTASSRHISRLIDATEKLKVAYKPASLSEAEELFWKEEVKGILVITSDFEREFLKGNSASLSVYCDASYFLLYKETLTASVAASSSFSAGVEIRRLLTGGSTLEQAILQRDPLQAKYYSLYNPASAYGSYVMPGILIVILQQTLLIGIGMISGASREKNNKLLLPGIHFNGGAFSTIVGKSLAYFCVAILTSTFTLVWIYDWFGFPSKTAYFNVLALFVPYAFATIFLGLALSFLFHKREQSIMFLVFLSPIVLFLSGISWPLEAMPVMVQRIASLFPSTYMVRAYLSIRTMGVELSDVKHELIVLYIQLITYLLLAVGMYKFIKWKQGKAITH